MKPLIVMGMGRSGTRYFADILSSHDEVVLHGEIPHSAMARFIKLLDVLDQEHGRDKVRLRKWNEKKSDFILNAFGSMAMGGGAVAENCKYVGHKTPRSEKFFDAYEKHFSSANNLPIYYYCIRSPIDVWASFKNMPWNVFSSVEHFIGEYVTSYKRYARACNRASGRVHLINLEDYKRSAEPIEFLKNEVFSKLDIKADMFFMKSLDNKENTNSSSSFIGKMPDEISVNEVDAIMNSADIQLIVKKHFSWLL